MQKWEERADWKEMHSIDFTEFGDPFDKESRKGESPWIIPSFSSQWQYRWWFLSLRYVRWWMEHLPTNVYGPIVKSGFRSNLPCKVRLDPKTNCQILCKKCESVPPSPPPLIPDCGLRLVPIWEFVSHLVSCETPFLANGWNTLENLSWWWLCLALA